MIELFGVSHNMNGKGLHHFSFCRFSLRVPAQIVEHENDLLIISECRIINKTGLENRCLTLYLSDTS